MQRVCYSLSYNSHNCLGGREEWKEGVFILQVMCVLFLGENWPL